MVDNVMGLLNVRQKRHTGLLLRPVQRYTTAVGVNPLQRGRNAAVSPKPVIGTYGMSHEHAMTLGALVPVGRACMRVSVFGLGKVAKPCQAR